MISPTEEEIVARAMCPLLPTMEGEACPHDTNERPCTPENCTPMLYSQAAIHALDQYRAKNAGEVEEALSLHADDDCDGKFVPTHICNIAANLITSLRSIMGEKDEANLFEFMEDECLTLKCQSYSNGDAGDADIGWEVIQYHMAKPRERIIAQAGTPLEAIRLARSSLSDGVK